MKDLETIAPKSGFNMPNFNKTALVWTSILSVFVMQVKVQVDVEELRKKQFFLADLGVLWLIIMGTQALTISLGYFVGFRTVVISGFVLVLLSSIEAKLSVLLDYKALQSLAMIHNWYSMSVIIGVLQVNLFLFGGSNMRLISLSLALILLLVSTNILVVRFVPPWLVSNIYAIYCFAMIGVVSKNLPNTPPLNGEITLPKVLPHIIGFAGHMITCFVWYQNNSEFEIGSNSYNVFLGTCIVVGVVSLGMILYGYPSHWKQGYYELKQKLLEYSKTWNNGDAIEGFIEIR